MDENQLYTIILRHDTSTQWMIEDPILSNGEYGVEDDTHRIKRGDGISKWSELTYDHFGFEYAITFENLQGDIEDNETLKNAIDSKVSKSIFEPSGDKLISSITLVDDKEDTIAELKRTYLNVKNGSTTNDIIDIVSTDKSIDGIWTIASGGERALNLISKASIQEYKVAFTYYANQICYYDNKILKAKETIFTTPDVDYSKWTVIASTHAKDLKYSGTDSTLTSRTVEDAITELSNRNDNKVEKTTQKNKLYGTDDFGNQVLIDIDDVGTVDTVNGVEPDVDENVVIDAKDIKMDKNDRSSRTIYDEVNLKDTIEEVDRKIQELHDDLDAQKVNRDIGDTIVTNFKLSKSFDSPTFTITKADTQSQEETVIDYHFETTGYLRTRVENDTLTIDADALTDEVNSLNTRMDGVEDNLDNAIERIDEDIEALDQKIDTNTTSLENEITELDTKVDNNVNRIDDEIADINSDIDIIGNRLDDHDNEITNIKNVNSNQEQEITTIKGRLDDHDNIIVSLRGRDNDLDQAIQDTNTRITNEVNTIDDQIDLLKAKDRSLDDDISNINEALNDHLTELNTINRKITDINTKDQQQDNRLDAIDDRLEELDGVDASILQDIANLQAVDTIHDNKFAEVDNELASLRAKDSSLDDDITNLNTRITNTNTTMNTYKRELDDEIARLDQVNASQDERLESELSTINNKFDEVDSSILALQEKDEELEDAIEANETAINTLNTNFNTYKTTQAQIDSNQNSRMDAIDTTISTLNTKVENYKISLDTKDAELEERIDTNKTNLDNQIAKEAQDVDDLRSADATINLKNNEQDSRLDIDDIRLDGHDSDISSLRTMQTTLNNKIDGALQDITELDEQVHSELQDIQDIAEDQQLMIDAMNGSITTINGSITNIRNKDQEQDRTINALRQTVNDHYDEFNATIADIAALDQTQETRLSNLATDQSNLSLQISNMDTEISNISSGLSDTNEAVATMNDTIAAMNDTIALFQNDLETEENRNNIQDGRLDTIDDNIDDLRQDMEDADNHLQTEIDAINVLDASQDVEITSLKSRMTTAEGNIVTNTTNIAQNASDIDDLDETKLDKTFADIVDKKLMSDLRLIDPSGTNIITFEEDKLNVLAGSKITSRLKITSSDNTIVARANKDEQGNLLSVDISTNLDIDVNYFMTSETLSTTIGDVNQLDIENISAITKPNIELQDIVTDAEGTWSRVQSINNEDGIISTITFQKQKITTWGAVAGVITDQTDLQDEFDTFGTNIVPNGSSISLRNRNNNTLGTDITLTDLDTAITFTSENNTLKTKINAENIDFNARCK